MASEMIVIQHGGEGPIRFSIPEDTVTVDMEVMTLKGVHILGKTRTPVRKPLFPGAKTTLLPYPF